LIFDIAIIGYGPIGALLANLLGQFGLTVVVIEKEQDVYPLPRAIHFDGEVMRVFQTAGLREAVEAISRPGLRGMHFVNDENETLLIRAGGPLLGPHGCATNYYFHQPDLENVLRRGVSRYPNVVTRLGVELEAIDDQGTSVELSLKDEHPKIRARYVVGCDGTRSLVRKSMASFVEDLGLHQPWIVFDVLLRELGDFLPDHTVQHCNPERPMTYCNVTANRRRWEIMLMPGDNAQLMLEPTVLWSLVQPWIKPHQGDIERATIYTFHSVITKGWRNKRLLLAGDSAHQMPPFLGQGMCSGIRDVANLAWKLAAVLGKGNEGGIASFKADTLLDSYESERSPHVRDFINLAMKIGEIIQITDRTAARARDSKFLAGEPEVFQFPAPRLGPGWVDTSGNLAGQIFPQPRLANGRLLDDVIGTNFAVLISESLLEEVDPLTLDLWAQMHVQVVTSLEPSIKQWLENAGVAAVILRPDRYVLGTTKTAFELNSLTQAFLISLKVGIHEAIKFSQ
jgi:3-(3-hydroxy-phenyl)propionate hydroxylase